MGLFFRMRQFLGHPSSPTEIPIIEHKGSARKKLGRPKNRAVYDAKYEDTRRKKVRLTLRVEAHTSQGIKDFCSRAGTNVSELTETFYSGLLYSKKRAKLLKIIEKVRKTED